MVVALVCSVPPFASLAFELWADKTGRLAPSTDRSQNGPATERDGVGV